MSFARFIAAAALALSLATTAAVAAPTVTSANLNLRIGPGLNYRVNVVIPAGSAVDVVSCGGTWCIVEWAGATGYVDGNYLMQAVTIVVSPLLTLPR
ncbi:SH3 domain-containing protein [Bauldia litoralis]|uniref:SH3 domain-containing protein n=1 Tax=Bauldia litoralis TaxID=665467 RepID=UPI003265010F